MDASMVGKYDKWMKEWMMGGLMDVRMSGKVHGWIVGAWMEG